MSPDMLTLAIAAATFAILFLAALSAAIIQTANADRWRHRAAEWRSVANERRRILNHDARRRAVVPDPATAGRVLAVLRGETERVR